MILRISLILSAFLALSACSSPAQNKTTPTNEPIFRPWGIIGAKITDTMEGILVTDVIQGSTAESAGMRVDDYIRSVDGKRATSTEQLMSDIRSRLPGTVMQVQTERNRRTTMLQVTVGMFPLDEQLWLMASSALKAWDSLRARQLSDEFARSCPPSSRYAARMARLRTELGQQEGTGNKPQP
ncbi:MAG TPA: PDZ domain-containing protein [Spirochaetota bacterium]|nr:PDZ domain-containing protein [Spirochaetota bacterium]HPH01967.1 PDZ domain-containing protein [Spirochaetota bacterium]HPN83205.1 PDZ domain-containing protein [Spirochaetota bacterium]